MIKYNNSNINDWYFYDDNIIKVYRNNAVCYYKVTSSGGTTAQTPCYAVVGDISQYTDTEFVDVYNKADGKWYKLNNLNQYEEYGVYGNGRTITYYEGKLTIDDNHEYIYSGGSWDNVGEVSGTSRLPQGYTEVEYIQNTSSAYINTGFINTKNTEFELDFQITDGVSQDRKIIGQGFKFGLGQEVGYWRIVDSAWYRTSESIDTNRHIAHTDTGKYYIDDTLIADRYNNKTQGTYSMLLFAVSSRYSISPDGNCALMKMYNCKIYDDGTLVRDFVPCTRTSDNVAGAYDIVNNGFYTSVNSSYSFVASPVSGQTVYPMYYDEKTAPPDNVSFSSMTEAEEYECPWVGMTGIISNTDYIFDENYDWVTKYGLFEVTGEYMCDNGNKYKKMEEKIRNVDDTWGSQTPAVYEKGDLIESASTDCQNYCGYNLCYVLTGGSEGYIDNGTSTLTRNDLNNLSIGEATVGAATTTIGEYCFQYIKSTLTSLTIGNTVTIIQHEAFMETNYITTLTIPSSVQQIDFWAFTRCTSLTEVIFEGTTPPTFTNSHSGVFHDYCPPVIYVPDSALSAYRAIDGSVWTNKTWSSDIIQPISLRP